jgi:hypothetical protein
MREAGNLRKEWRLKGAARAAENKTPMGRRPLFLGVFALFVFSLGFVSAGFTARETLEQRDAAQANLRVSQLQNRLATAALNARRGAFEPARLAASDFFTDLRAELERPECAFGAAQRAAVEPVLSERDAVVTLLARNDRAAGERLTDLYLEYVRAVNPSAAPRPQ